EMAHLSNWQRWLWVPAFAGTTPFPGSAAFPYSLLPVFLAEFQRRQHLAGTRRLELDAVVVIVVEIEGELLSPRKPVHDRLIELEDAADGGLVHHLPLRLQ